MSEITRDNHYVPQSMIRRWSLDGKSVQAYRTLVSHPRVPLWSSRSVRHAACRRDLYTEMVGGSEWDAFEKWIEVNFESPGLAAVDKAIKGRRLSPNDWHALIRLYAAQCVRTPTSYLEHTGRFLDVIQPTLSDWLASCIEELEASAAFATPVRDAGDWSGNELSELLQVKIDDAADSEGEVKVQCSVSVGRQSWLARNRYLLNGVAKTLCEHRWSILSPYGDEEWLLTDQPALRVNCYEQGKYDFGGGWGRIGSDLMMPISPKLLLHVQVGARGAPRQVCSLAITRMIQRFYAEAAHRWVFGTRPYEWVAQMRPRVIDREAFESEARQWKGWHDAHSAAEGP